MLPVGTLIVNEYGIFRIVGHRHLNPDWSDDKRLIYDCKHIMDRDYKYVKEDGILSDWCFRNGEFKLFDQEYIEDLAEKFGDIIQDHHRILEGDD